MRRYGMDQFKIKKVWRAFLNVIHNTEWAEGKAGQWTNVSYEMEQDKEIKTMNELNAYDGDNDTITINNDE